MAGEFKTAEQILSQAFENADSDSTMSTDAMGTALLCTLLSTLSKTQSRKSLDQLIAYHLDSQEEDEFVVTRGC